jgi:hypothetical protein
VPKTRMPPLSDPELLAYSAEHLWYEWWMLKWAVARLASVGSQQEVNALVECFAIHSRNLIDFLYPTNANPKPTDILACDFFPDPDKWSPKTIHDELERARTMAHKQISHLTKGRIKEPGPDKVWHFAPVSKELGALLRIFSVQASPLRLHQKFIDSVT